MQKMSIKSIINDSYADIAGIHDSENNKLKSQK